MNRPPHFTVFPPPPPYTLPTLHRQHIEPTSNAHRAYINSTSTQPRPDIDATLSFYFNTVPWIVKLCTSTTATFLFLFPATAITTAKFVLFSPHHHHHQKDNHISFVSPPPTPPPPPPPQCTFLLFFCQTGYLDGPSVLSLIFYLILVILAVVWP